MSVAFSQQKSWFESTARGRIAGLLDANSFQEILPPGQAVASPHLASLDIPGAFDDGAVIGSGLLDGKKILIAAQEGQFLGGAVGEIHGAKVAGLLRLALQQRPAAVLLVVDSGGVRLHEANAGLIAISEIMRAVLEVRAAGIPVIALIGGLCGAFGGMGIVSCLCSAIVISEEGRLALSGPEVIETVAGVEEFDSKDRGLVWRVTGGKHRFLMGHATQLAEDDPASFRKKTLAVLAELPAEKPTLAQLRKSQSALVAQNQRFGKMRDGLEVWKNLGVANPERIPMLDSESVIAIRKGLTAR